MPFLRGFGAVGRDRRALRSADAEGEDRNPARRRRVRAARRRHALSPSETSSTDWYPRSPSCSNAVAAAARALGRSVAGIAEVVGGGGVEEALEGGLIAGERQLEKGAATEDDETDPVLRCGRQHLRALRALPRSAGSIPSRAHRPRRSSNGRDRAAPARRVRCAASDAGRSPSCGRANASRPRATAPSVRAMAHQPSAPRAAGSSAAPAAIRARRSREPCRRLRGAAEARAHQRQRQRPEQQGAGRQGYPKLRRSWQGPEPGQARAPAPAPRRSSAGTRGSRYSSR